MLVVLDVTDSQTAHVVESCSESDGIGNIWRSCLETCRWHIILSMLDGHILNHVTATLPWLHLIQECLTAIDYSDTVRTVDLMSAEHEEICTKCLHIDWCVGNGLRTVNQDWYLV